LKTAIGLDSNPTELPARTKKKELVKLARLRSRVLWLAPVEASASVGAGCGEKQRGF